MQLNNNQTKQVGATVSKVGLSKRLLLIIELDFH